MWCHSRPRVSFHTVSPATTATYNYKFGNCSLYTARFTSVPLNIAENDVARGVTAYRLMTSACQRGSLEFGDALNAVNKSLKMEIYWVTVVNNQRIIAWLMELHLLHTTSRPLWRSNLFEEGVVNMSRIAPSRRNVGTDERSSMW